MSGIPVWGPWPPDWWIYVQQENRDKQENRDRYYFRSLPWGQKIVPVPIFSRANTTRVL